MKNSQTSTPLLEPTHQLSEMYFSECNDLKQIQQPFKIDQITNQIEYRDLESQFQLLRALTQTKKHKMQLRSNSVFEIDHSRVILQQEDEEVSSNNKNKKLNQQGYVNANFVPFYCQSQDANQKKLIITQGPNTESIPDFKQMLKQEEVECVLMLCRLKENGKNKCSDYLQDTVQKVSRKDAKTNRQLQQLDEDEEYLSSQIVNLGQKFDNFKFTHVLYRQWPDRRVPKQIKHLYEIIKQIQKFKNIVIHCSAGLGRSGVIATILLILNTKDWKNHQKVSIFRAVRKLRQSRFGAVQNSEQYKFIYSYFAYLQENSL